MQKSGNPMGIAHHSFHSRAAWRMSDAPTRRGNVVRLSLAGIIAKEHALYDCPVRR
jgi:hypothetical protein